MTQNTYKTRIYQNYNSSRKQNSFLENKDELAARAPYLRKIIKLHFPLESTANILDLGCGYGAFVYFLKEAGYGNIVGIDTSIEQIAIAKRLGINEVSEGNLLEELKTFEDNSQNVVITFDVIEHFTKEELVILVEQVYRVLSEGGRWILHTPNGESPFIGRIFFGDFTHEQAFTRISISQVLVSYNFRQVECFEDVPVVHGIKSAFRWIIWKIIRLGLRLYIAAETGDTSKMAIFTQNFLIVATK